jgi:hypothetical protein
MILEVISMAPSGCHPEQSEGPMYSHAVSMLLAITEVLRRKKARLRMTRARGGRYELFPF